MTSTLAFRCANDPKDFSLWDSHKDTFRQLFLDDGMSLAKVKAKMEVDFGFPVINIKTYEVVFREHFKFRKKLEAGQWLLVDRELDIRKRQRLDCDVYLCGKRMDPRHVSRNIRRERRESVQGKLKSTNTTDLIPLVNPPSNQDHVLETTVVDESMIQYIISNPISKEYGKLREIVPSRGLMQFLRGLWKGNTLTSEDKFLLAGALHDLVYMISDYVRPRDSRKPPIIVSQPLPRPRMFGINASIEVLEAACIHLSNNNVDSEDQYMSPVANWIAQVADPMLLQQFFRLEQPSVAAVWQGIYAYSVLTKSKAFSILVEVALRIHRGSWLRARSETALLGAILLGDEAIAERLMDSWQTSIGHTEPPKLSGALLSQSGEYSPDHLLISMEIMMRQAARHDIDPQDLNDALGSLIFKCHGWDVDTAQWILQVGVTINPAVSSWVPPSTQLLPSNWNTICGSTSFYKHQLKAFFRDNGHGKRPSCSLLMKTFVPVWGCVVAAKSGKNTLQQFMGSLHDITPRDKCQLQQLALSEVAGQGDIETTRLFLDIGVGPQVKLLPRVGNICYLDPLSQAACRGKLEMINFLLSYGIWECRHILRATKAASCAWERKYLNVGSSSLDYENQSATIALLLDVDLRGIWEEASARNAFSSQSWILDHCQNQIDLQMALSTQPCAVLHTIFPHDTLREAIRYGFSFGAIESLVTTGETVDSQRDDNGNTMLIDALLSESRDRYRVVHFLLRRGADPRINGLNITVLDATLRNIEEYPKSSYLSIGPTPGRLGIDEDRKTSFKLFRDLYELGASLNPEPSRQKPRSKPLLVPLIENGAELSLIQQVVVAGANINDRREEYITTPLASAIYWGQLEVSKWLLEQGADANVFGYQFIFYRACKMGVSFVQRLVEKGADLEPQVPHTLPPLHQAILYGNIDIIIMLLAHGVQINYPRPLYLETSDQHYAVDYAAFEGKLDILKLLVESGGRSIYPGISGFDKVFYTGYRNGHIGVLMFIEQHTGWSTSTVISSLRLRGFLGL
ncbi:ankyrin [Apiospora rasikravindrae]|uniref:Ankyrin n=1 Tax=Apiospora rasikravindrae TaxID=990691 RepID=A0ABR1U2X3_9PEZI